MRRWLFFAPLLAGCFTVHLRRLPDEERVKRVLTLTGTPACVQAVTFQVLQGAMEEVHEVLVDDGKFTQVLALPFAPGKPLTVYVAVSRASSPCNPGPEALLVAKVAAPGEAMLLAFKTLEARPPVHVPGGGLLPGQPGGPELGTATGADAPATLAPDPGVGTSVVTQLTQQKDTAPHAVEGQAHLVLDYPWQQSARGLYWLTAHARTDPKKVRGSDVLFAAETDCQDAAWYQYVQRRAVFLNTATPPQPVGSGFIGRNGRQDIAGTAAPVVDEALPYPAQLASGPSPAMETTPGIPIRTVTADPQDVIDTFSGVLGGGKYRFKGTQRMRLEHRFWTYLICRAPYVILGHYEWGTDVTVSSVRDEPPFQPPGLQDPVPAPVWVPGP
jgi:hypothetical protein